MFHDPIQEILLWKEIKFLIILQIIIHIITL